MNAPIEVLSLQSSVSADVVSQSSKFRQILTKYLQEKHKQKFLEAIKEQQEAKGQTSRTDENSKVRVIVTLDADAAVDHTAKPTGSTESVKKIEKAVDKVTRSKEHRPTFASRLKKFREATSSARSDIWSTVFRSTSKFPICKRFRI